MIEIVTMCASLLSLGLLAAMSGVLAYERRCRHESQRQEFAAEEGMRRAAEEEDRKSRAMDEGFDNLMRYSVRGQDGFGGTE